MAFPMINFKVTSAQVSDELKDVVEMKFSSLEKFIGNATAICDVEFEKMTAQHSGNVFRMEANLQIDGKLYRAEATMDSFEKAIDEVRSELDKELRRANSKKETLFKRGGRKIKEMLRFGS